jgi:hypothetical protein
MAKHDSVNVANGTACVYRRALGRSQCAFRICTNERALDINKTLLPTEERLREPSRLTVFAPHGESTPAWTCHLIPVVFDRL